MANTLLVAAGHIMATSMSELRCESCISAAVEQRDKGIPLAFCPKITSYCLTCMDTLLSPHDHHTYTRRRLYERRTTVYIRIMMFLQVTEDTHNKNMLNHCSMLTITIAILIILVISVVLSCKSLVISYGIIKAGQGSREKAIRITFLNL